MEKSQANLVVKIIAILGYIAAVLGFIGGLIALFSGSFLGAIFPNMGRLVGAMVIVGGVIAIILGVFGFIVAMNLWKFRNWARIVVIVFSALGFIQGLLSLPLGLIWIIIHGLIIYFLAFNKDVMALFKK